MRVCMLVANGIVINVSALDYIMHGTGIDRIHPLGYNSPTFIYHELEIMSPYRSTRVLSDSLE